MHHTSLSGQKIAVLVANGFHENHLTQVQRSLQESGAHMQIVSMDHGLVNGWKDDSWGLHFASDQVLHTALAVDYDILIIPGGARAMEKLSLTGHTRRFIGGFVNAGKAVVAFDEAADLLKTLEFDAQDHPHVLTLSTDGAEAAPVMADMCRFLMADDSMKEAA